MNQCSSCHTPLEADGKFCSHCGTPSGELAAPDPNSELRQRLSRTLAGRYEIVRLLGRGGMAVVFLANDITLERQVAIKVLPPEMSHDPSVISRFLQEAKTAARLDHPNIIPIYRVESEGGLVYFVMKYVTGHSLDQLLDRGPVAFDAARRILREAALALGHAHQRGIVHRDVKPANIMLESDGRVVLTDFGISKALDGGSALTGTGNIIGTPHYMAPEQAKGLSVDGRVDQYALAVVGHQILTGRQPFDGSAHSILYKQVFEQPPRIFEARPDAPPDLCAALDRALAKDPEVRFRSMEDFAAAVSGQRGSDGATAVTSPMRRVGGRIPGGQFLRRPLVRRTVLAAIFSLAVGGAAWAGFQPLEQRAASVKAARAAPEHIEVPIDSVPPQPASQPVAKSSRGDTVATQPGHAPRPARKEYALLTVSSEPWGTLFVNDKEIGPTPIADYPLPAGTHRLRLEQEGYRSKHEIVVVSGSNPVRRRYNLEPAGPP